MTAPALNGFAHEALELPLSLGRLRRDDFAYARNSFAEGHKTAPGVESMSWRYYKRFIVPMLESVLRNERVEVAAAYLGADIVGWVAFSRGKYVDALHWVHTRWKIGADGESLRRNCGRGGGGIMTALLDYVELRNRLAYTWRGGKGKHDHDGLTMDERLLPWLASRGQHAAYLPWDEWNK